MEEIKMKILCAHTEVVEVESLVPHPLNPNTHSEEQLNLIAKILKHQGWRHPITVSKRSGFIVAGHGRLEAAQINGWTHVPIDRQDFATEADEYAHLVADNKLAELAEFDDAKMKEGAAKLGEDFDFDLLGIPDLGLVDEINKGDEKSEWVGQPEFNEGGKYINLTYQFKTEEDREQYCKENDITIDKKNAGQWIIYK